MKKGGVGGANTNLNGLRFEKETSLEEALTAANFCVDEFVVSQNGILLAELIGKHRLYIFLQEQGIDWTARLSARLLPDEAIFSSRSRKLTIIEKKWQGVSGSVDEKLQTCGFKIRQYRKLLDGLEIEVQYIYLLNDWFAHPRYADVLAYIKESGADYHFNSVPLELLDI